MKLLGLATVVAALLVGLATTESLASTESTRGATAEAAKVRVPNVIGFRMDRATRTLHDRGLRVNEECSGLFGCIIKSRWWVCVQSPRAGRLVAKYSVVVIYAERRGEC
jgi:hypothetical protein